MKIIVRFKTSGLPPYSENNPRFSESSVEGADSRLLMEWLFEHLIEADNATAIVIENEEQEERQFILVGDHLVRLKDRESAGAKLAQPHSQARAR